MTSTIVDQHATKKGGSFFRRMLYYSDSVDFLVLPRVSSHCCLGSKPARGAPLLSDMVGMAPASAASNVGSLAAGLSERGCTLGHIPGPGWRAMNEEEINVPPLG